MHIDNTNITVDTTKDPFKDFGPSIIENLVEYISFEYEEEELYLSFQLEFFSTNTYNLFVFLYPLAITFIVSSSIIFHTVDVNTIMRPFSTN